MGKLKRYHSWVNEAMTAHSVWRADAWKDYEFRDGLQWDTLSYQALIDKGINPITVNRVFPVINKVYGNFLKNQRDVIAKGRTKKDHELSQVMSECLAMVIDQNKGQRMIKEAVLDAFIVGFGGLTVGYNHDPRREKISIKPLQWYSTWWDPYADPWMNVDTCKYVYTAEWKDLDDLVMFFPNKKSELEDQYRDAVNQTYMTYYDEGDQVEESKANLISSQWVHADRKRVRPVEMWYTKVEPCWFAAMLDGSVIELKEQPINEQYEIASYATEVINTHVKKMQVATFFGNVILQDLPTPFAFDTFPQCPFIGYLNRFKQPFGLVRQISEMNREVNKRRSMALALVGSRRVKAEEGSATNMDDLYDEANRLDSFMVVKKDKMNRVQVEELAQLAQPQIDLMHQSETEIKEVIGDESLGFNPSVQTGVALDKKDQSAATMTFSLLDNVYDSQKIMGEKIMSLVQESWTEEKVLRVIDRLSGVEKFVDVNKRAVDPETGQIIIKNNLTQGRYDLVVSTKSMTDTMRDKNLDLLFSAINKAPAEAVPPLLSVAFEISDIPEKERILDQVRAATGMSSADDDLTADQRKEKQRLEEAAMRSKQQRAEEADSETKTLEDEKRRAEVKKLMQEGEAKMIEAQAAKQKADQEGYFKGQEIARGLDDTARGKDVGSED